ncbi:MAG: hypothetical protein PHO65_06325 [Sulfurovum sp.]|nr:hypothetical protein [Sulfurovum sp.]
MKINTTEVEEPNTRKKGSEGGSSVKGSRGKSQTRRFTYFEQGVKETLPRLPAFSKTIINDGG